MMPAEYGWAKLAYEAYIAQTGGVSVVTGDKLPEFDLLKQPIKDAWIAAATALAKHLGAYDEADAVKLCTRDSGHSGPCNGFPREACY